MKTTKYLSGMLGCLIVLLTNSCQDQQAKEQLTKFQQAELMKANNIEVAKKLYKYLDEVNLDTVRALCSPDVKIYYESGPPASIKDIEPLVKLYYKTFPDYKHEIEDIFAENDKVVIRIGYSGTLSETFMDIKPNGQKFTYKGIHIFQLASNKVINWWAVEDELGMMTQLGMELKQK
jgi:predicted ester cyclase